MKVSLSRKGFDTTWGDRPSPIFPDGTLLSIPIPNNNHCSGRLYDNKTKYPPLQYKDLHIPYHVRKNLANLGVDITNLVNYQDLMVHLFPNNQFRFKDKWFSFDSDYNLYCHLDPDIYRNILPREKEWSPLFGQVDTAQSYLSNNKFGVGDLFLFFGRFQHVKIENRKIVYDGAIKGKHIIFGYLLVDSIITRDSKLIEGWMEYHPHFDKELWIQKNNTIYVAAKEFSNEENLPGAGYFKYSDDLILTESEKSINPKENMTIWKKSFIPEECKVALVDSDKFGRKENYFKGKEIGQELVVKNCPSFTKKIISLIKSHIFI